MSAFKVLIAFGIIGLAFGQGEMGSGSGSGSGSGVGSGSGEAPEEPIDCGEPQFDNKGVLTCTSNLRIEGVMCDLACNEGFANSLTPHNPDLETSRYTIVCTENGWLPVDQDVQCVDVDPCLNDPCITNSICVDASPPDTGYTCQCASHINIDPSLIDPMTGEGCESPSIVTTGGSVKVSVGAGRDIAFSIGGSEGLMTNLTTLVTDIDNLEARAENSEADIVELDSDIADLTIVVGDVNQHVEENEDRIFAAENRLDSADTDRSSLRGLVDTINDEDGPIRTLISSNKMKIQLNDQRLIDLLDDHNDLNDQHEITKGAAAALELEVENLSDDLDREILNRNTAITSVMNRIDDETTSRMAAVRALQSADSTITSRLTSAMNCLSNPGSKWINNACVNLGAASNNPAPSCRALLKTSHGTRSQAYFLKHGTRIAKAYCHQSLNGGGWEMVLSLNGGSTTLQYDSSYWKSGSNLLGVNDFNTAHGRNRKHFGFNYGRYGSLYVQLKRADTSTSWDWLTPQGFSTHQTPQAYFNTKRIITQDRNVRSGTAVATVFDSMEWVRSKNQFSASTCIARLSINDCTAGHSCARWGFHWNNECSFGSDDVGGGIGTKNRQNAKSAGNWHTCCCSPCRAQRAHHVIMWAREV